MRTPIRPAGLTRPAQLSAGIGENATAGAFEDLARAASAIGSVAEQHEQFAMQAAISKTRRAFDKRVIELRSEYDGDVAGFENAVANAKAEFVKATDGRLARSLDATLTERGHVATLAMAEERLARDRAEAQEGMSIETARSRAELESFVDTVGAGAFRDPRFGVMVSEYNALIDARRDSGHENFSPERAEYEKKSLFDTLQVLAAKPEIDAAFEEGGAVAALEAAEAIAMDPSFELTSQDREQLKSRLVSHASFLDRKENARLADIRHREMEYDRIVAKRGEAARSEMVRMALKGELTPEWILNNRDLDPVGLSQGLQLVSGENNSPSDDVYALDLRRRARGGEDVGAVVAAAVAEGRISLSVANQIDEESQAAKDKVLSAGSRFIDKAFGSGPFADLDPTINRRTERLQVDLREWRDANPDATYRDIVDYAEKLVSDDADAALVQAAGPARPKSAADIQASIDKLLDDFDAGRINEDKFADEFERLKALEAELARKGGK